MRSTAFFKLYKICILLHRCNLKIFAKNRFEKNSNFREISTKKLQMSQNLQNVVKFQKFQIENLVDFEKCCKTHIFLQKLEPIQPKTSNILAKFCQPTVSDVSASVDALLDFRAEMCGRYPYAAVPGRSHAPRRRGRADSPGLISEQLQIADCMIFYASTKSFNVSRSC